MKPKKLKGNQETQHPDVFGKPRDFFLKKLDAHEKKKHKQMPFLATVESAVKASYVHALHFVKTMKKHIIYEELLLPAKMDLLRFMCGEKEAKRLEFKSISNVTVKRQIQTCLLMYCLKWQRT